MAQSKHITRPGGFLAAAVHCGLKTTEQEDLAILASENLSSAAIVTTTNQVVGAPVRWCRRVLPRGCGKVRGVVVNAGNSNVCNGARGDRDAAAMAKRTARHLGCDAEEVLVCSTGVIGRPLPMRTIRAGIDAAAERLGRDHDAAVARAIMTTDTREKTVALHKRIGGRVVNVCGVAKGAGMIAPSLATMLSFITTDAKVSPPALRRALKAATEPTFNAVTIDSDTSTSDTVIVLASGAAGGRAVTGGETLAAFTELLTEACASLAEMIVRDGEGATKLIRVTVGGAATDADAKAAAKSIADSPLLKCAANGGDPNWGRIIMAAGKSRAKVDQDRVTCKIGPVTVMRDGSSRRYDLAAAEKHMAGATVEIDLNLNLGDGRYTALTCDFSRDYVTINADYHT